MKHVRNVNRAAAALNGFALGAVLIGAGGIATALLILASILIIRNLEALRAHLTRETRS